MQSIANQSAKKSKLYVTVKYSCVPVNQPIIEYANNFLYREDTQLFYTKSNQTFIFNKLDNSEMDFDFDNNLIFFEEVGYFEVESAVEEMAILEFNSQLNEMNVDSKYILLYSIINEPFLLAPNMIQFENFYFEPAF